MRMLLCAVVLLLGPAVACAQAPHAFTPDEESDPAGLHPVARNPAVHGPMHVYRLPFANGRSFMVGQAPGGLLTTHATPASWHAIDIAMPEGTPVVAARAGSVIQAVSHLPVHGEQAPPEGNTVRILHDDGTIAGYHHLAPGGVTVGLGEAVVAGQVIGYSGSTGHSSGPHLHFAVTRLVATGERLVEVSEPVVFHAGRPPRSVSARPGIVLTADY